MPRPSPARRALTWWFAPPYNPWIAASFAVDASPARAYLAELRQRTGAKVSLNTLTAASIARALRAWPKANGRVVGGRILLDEHVGMAMPVNLLDTGRETSEVAMALVERVDTLPLAQLAEHTRSRFEAEREGRRSHPLAEAIWRLAHHAPDPVFEGALGALDRVVNHRWTGPSIYRRVGITTGLSNVGAAMTSDTGILFRAVSIAPPQRLFQVGTFWGASIVQDEVVAIGGRVEIRPMLPMVMLFDHRLIDGVAAGRLGGTFGEIFRAPEVAFGREGEKLG